MMGSCQRWNLHVSTTSDILKEVVVMDKINFLNHNIQRYTKRTTPDNDPI